MMIIASQICLVNNTFFGQNSRECSTSVRLRPQKFFERRSYFGAEIASLKLSDGLLQWLQRLQWMASGTTGTGGDRRRGVGKEMEGGTIELGYKFDSIWSIRTEAELPMDFY